MGRIHSLEHFSTVDGPGIRFVAFLQGCPIRCQWCHNPDTWDLTGGSDISAEALFEKAMRYKPYFDASGGGVTVSGGEPLLQAAFVADFFHQLRASGVSTCLDTAGFLSDDHTHLFRLLESTDLVLLDIKHIDPKLHLALTGADLAPVLTFLSHLNNLSIPVWIRHVVIPGITDAEEDILQLARLVKPFHVVSRIELLAYHTLGKHKYSELGFPEPLPGISDASHAQVTTLQELADSCLARRFSI